MRTLSQPWVGGLECRPLHQKVGGLIPSQGTQLGCRFDPRSGCIWEATNGYFSSSLSLSFPLSLKSRDEFLKTFLKNAIIAVLVKTTKPYAKITTTPPPKMSHNNRIATLFYADVGEYYTAKNTNELQPHTSVWAPPGNTSQWSLLTVISRVMVSVTRRPSRFKY